MFYLTEGLHGEALVIFFGLLDGFLELFFFCMVVVLFHEEFADFEFQCLMLGTGGCKFLYHTDDGTQTGEVGVGIVSAEVIEEGLPSEG